MRKIQIGVMGSAADLGYTKDVSDVALEVGREVARLGATLVFGAEKDCTSLSTQAAIGAKEAGGTTLGVTYGKGLSCFDERAADVVVATGSERGGGREFVLVNSCDVLIAIGGGSGTLTEIAMAYQLGICVVVVSGTGGWSEQLEGKFLDGRERLRCEVAVGAREAVLKAISLARLKYTQREDS